MTRVGEVERRLARALRAIESARLLQAQRPPDADGAAQMAHLAAFQATMALVEHFDRMVVTPDLSPVVDAAEALVAAVRDFVSKGDARESSIDTRSGTEDA
jgi:hypothetical protein